jgi:hypothetical protein
MNPRFHFHVHFHFHFAAVYLIERLMILFISAQPIPRLKKHIQSRKRTVWCSESKSVRIRLHFDHRTRKFLGDRIWRELDSYGSVGEVFFPGKHASCSSQSSHQMIFDCGTEAILLIEYIQWHPRAKTRAYVQCRKK